MNGDRDVVCTCSACGSDEICAINCVLVKSYVSSWRVDSVGQLLVDDCSDSSVIWDSTLPADSIFPYMCNCCNRDLRAEEPPEDAYAQNEAHGRCEGWVVRSDGAA